ncbi:3340_t:CDS:2, partial [Paraglomus brasilianum]
TKDITELEFDNWLSTVYLPVNQLKKSATKLCRLHWTSNMSKNRSVKHAPTEEDKQALKAIAVVFSSLASNISPMLPAESGIIDLADKDCECVVVLTTEHIANSESSYHDAIALGNDSEEALAKNVELLSVNMVIGNVRNPLFAYNNKRVGVRRQAEKVSFASLQRKIVTGAPHYGNKPDFSILLDLIAD